MSQLPFAELQIPNDNRPEGAEPPDRIPVQGPWRYVGTTRPGMHKYATTVPIRPRGLFFHKPQPGMVLSDAEGTALRYDRFGQQKTDMWSHDRKELIVYRPEKTPPTDGEFFLSYPKAVDREGTLNHAWSGGRDVSMDPPVWRSPMGKEAFVWTTIQDDWDSLTGLLLPAPGHAAWSIEVPPSAELSFTGGLVRPEIRESGSSDGAHLVVEVEVGQVITEVYEADLATRSFSPHRVDLSAFAGQEVILRVKTEPGPTATFDYAFLADPVVASRLADPVRVVMVFIDTLRPDHMSLYGYERDTTKAIDHLADDAAVFTKARSVAPWTLPSARTIVTGRHPEFYDSTQTLQSRLQERGWATAFMAGNVYLSVNFDMHRDWSLHRVGLWPMAEKVTDDALSWLEDHDGRNGIIQVHYMDPHLPYIEPRSYRGQYAGEGPDSLREEFHLADVRRANIRADEGAQQYIRDRYDNNIRYTTDQVARLVETLDDNDILVIYADHGEEFWEHEGFEHGHSLFDELLRVPLVFRGPGIDPTEIDVPVSLLDITPTILDLTGVPIPDDLDGISLLPVMQGDAAAAESLADRDLAFGRPLYGLERWGVLHQDKKWTTTEGREAMYDLSVDAAEKSNLLIEDPDDSAAPFRDHLAAALGREVGVGYRLTAAPPHGGRQQKAYGTWALCTVPSGFAHSWMGDNPLHNAPADVAMIDDPEVIRERLDRYQIEGHEVPEDVGAAVEMCWHEGNRGAREIYLIPDAPMAESGPQIVCSAFQGDAQGGERATFQIEAGRQPTLGKLRIPLSRAEFKQRKLVMQFGISPIPTADMQALEGNDEELREALKAMGYAVADSEEVELTCPPPEVDLPPRPKNR